MMFGDNVIQTFLLSDCKSLVHNKTKFVFSALFLVLCRCRPIGLRMRAFRYFGDIMSKIVL